MPTVQVQLSDVKQRRETNNVLFTATDNQNRQIVREIDATDIDTWTAFAEWMILQDVEFITLPDKEKLLEITFHTETVTDPETGEEVTVRVLDSVEVIS